MYRNEVDALKTEDERVDRLTELNVREQVFNLAKTSIIQKAWKEDNKSRPHHQLEAGGQCRKIWDQKRLDRKPQAQADLTLGWLW